MFSSKIILIDEYDKIQGGKKMDIQETIEALRKKANDIDVFFFDAELFYDKTNTTPSVILANTDDNIDKIFRLAKEHSLPIFLEVHLLTQEEINESFIHLEEIDEILNDAKNYATNLLVLENPGLRAALEEKIHEQNKKVNQIECDILSAYFYTVLPSQIILEIHFFHEKHEEWTNTIYCEVEDLISEIRDASSSIDELLEQKAKEKEEQSTKMIIDIKRQWETFLLSQQDFNLQTNQPLRKSFAFEKWGEFLKSLSDGEKEVVEKYSLYYHMRSAYTEAAWKRFKNGEGIH